MVRIRMDLASPPPLSEEEKRQIDALLARTGEPDTSDIPELDESFWRNAVRNPFLKPVKTQLTVRMDADVLNWLRKGGRRYQTRMNAILRDAMLKDLAKS